MNFHIIQWEFFFFLVNFPCYLMGIIAFFFIFYLFSMLFNGDFSIFPFFVIVPCYSIGIFPFFQFLAIFHTIQWEFLYSSVFVNFPCYSIGIEVSGLRRWGGTYGRTDGRKDVRNLSPVPYRTSALWGRCPKRHHLGSRAPKS